MLRFMLTFVLVLLPLATSNATDVKTRGNHDAVVIGLLSAYQANVANSKTRAFVDGVGKSVQRPAYMATIVDADGLARLQQEHSHLLIFVPRNFVIAERFVDMTPLAQTSIAVALYAKPAPAAGSFDDLKRVSVRRFENVAEIAAELSRVNPVIKLAPLDSGTDQLRALMNGSTDGAVLNVGMYANLMPSLRDNYVPRYRFRHRQPIDGYVSPAFTKQEVKALRDYLLRLQGPAFSQLQQTFGISKFEMPQQSPTPKAVEP